MARLSKTAPFQIYSDDGPSTATEGTTERVDHDKAAEEPVNYSSAWTGGSKDDGFVTESDDERKGLNNDEAQEGDDEKNYTRTSISSFPDSTYPTDHEVTPMHKPYTPTYNRPTSRRMQMSSPLRNRKFGTPYSEPRGSPRSRRKDFDADSDGVEPKRHPLVLLHITALPVQIPWTYHAMREALPQHVLDNLQLLKSKLSATVLKRGILIPHPGDDYELLEEKLLEALELQEARISKCGHYRNRHSTDSTATGASAGADSGVGSSVDESDEEHCTTCHHHLHAAGSGKQKWAIKVYAANGLMRASAWSAAWSEMERVDVEIMPWIKDELRIKLDELNSQALVVKEIDHEAEELRVNQLVEERLRMMEEDSERARQAEMSREIERIVIAEQRQFSQATPDDPVEQIDTAKSDKRATADQPSTTELPNIYRPKDIPLSILLWNYMFLLAKKPFNMAMFFLVVFVSGMMLIVGPTGIAAGVVEMSTIVMSRSTNGASVQDMPDTVILEAVVPSVHVTPAGIESQIKSILDAAVPTEISVPESADNADSSVSYDQHILDEVHTNTEPIIHEDSAEPGILVEEEPQSDAMASEIPPPQLESPNGLASSDSLPAIEESPSMNVEYVQADADEHVEVNDDIGVESKMPEEIQDVEVETEISPAMEYVDGETVTSLEPEAVDVEEDSSSMSEDEVDFVATIPLQVDMLDKCPPYSMLLDDPAYCSIDEHVEAVETAMQ